MSEANKEVVRRYMEEIWSQGRVELVEELFAADSFFRALHSAEFTGREARKQFVAGLRAAFPDTHYSVDELIAEGDKVALRWSYEGTHQGEWFGIAPSGKLIRTSGASTFKFSDGRIQEELVQWDSLGFMRQLGIVSESDLQTEERNKGVVRLYGELFSQHNVDRLPEVLAEDYYGRGTALPEMRGIEGRRQLNLAVFAALPDLRLDLQEMVADGNTVVAHWHEVGTLTGELAGVAPTGKTAAFDGFSIFRLRDGKIAEEFAVWDALGMYQQLLNLAYYSDNLVTKLGRRASGKQTAASETA